MRIIHFVFIENIHSALLIILHLTLVGNSSFDVLKVLPDVAFQTRGVEDPAIEKGRLKNIKGVENGRRGDRGWQ